MNRDVDVMMRLVAPLLRLISMLCTRFNDLETTYGDGVATAATHRTISSANYPRLGRLCSSGVMSENWEDPVDM